MAEPCPCGSGKAFSECCEPLLNDIRPAESAEALMRSRYCAFVTDNIPYLRETLDRRKRNGFDATDVRTWNADVEWKGLRIVATEAGQPTDNSGIVEFEASFAKAGQDEVLHERSRFKKKDNRWYYVDGQHIHEGQAPRTESDAPVKAAPKIGRNAPCPCGSGKKYKRCCGQ